MNNRFPPSARLLTPARMLFGLGVLTHIIFLLSLHYGWLNGLFNDSTHRFGPGADFFSIYAAGVKARHGASLYTIMMPDGVPYAYAFRYAPICAYTLGLVLSVLPALSAYALWLVVCEWTLLRNIRLTFELAQDKASGFLAASLWLLFSPYYLELYVGQFTFVTASLVFWAYLSWMPQRKDVARSRLVGWMGDGFFGLGVWLKLMPLLFLPIALLRGRWKSALVVVVFLCVTSWLYFSRHPADWTAFRQLNTDPLPTWHAGNQGLMALAFTLLKERIAPFLAFQRAAVVAIGGLLLWMTLRAWQLKPVNAVQAGVTDAKSGTTGAIADEDSAQGEDRATDMAAPRTAFGSARPPSPSESRFEAQLLLLYAACSAAYLLLYKDVWEHHYLLLLPPLVLLALRRAPLGLWLPAFVLAAVPTLFGLYDVHGLGFNEDPERYWRPAVSVLQHGLKPLSALWLLAGAFGQSLPALASARRPQAGYTRQRRFARATPVASLLLAGLLLARWAGGAIVEQRRGVRERVWAPPLFQTQKHANTCGPAALASVCRYYGIPADEDEIAASAGTTEAGTSMLQLQRAAEQKGLATMGRQVTLTELRRLPLPCILYFHPGHFAVLTGVEGDRFLLADPRSGQHAWTAAQLARFWRGELLIVGPAERSVRRGQLQHPYSLGQ